MCIGWDVIFAWFGLSLGRFGAILVVMFMVFQSFGGAWTVLGPAWGPKVDLGPHLGGKRGLE